MVLLNGNPLPWVNTAKHLGNLLSSEVSLNPVIGDMSSDLLQKKAIFFSRVHEFLQLYGYCDPRMVVELIRIFATSFYGSPLWNMNSDEYGKLTRSWNTTLKMVWNLPYATHKRFLESLTEVPHLQSTLHSRYAGFLYSLMASSKPQVKMMSIICQDNLSTQTGQNIRLMLNLYSYENLKSLLNNSHTIKRIRVNQLEEGEEWKVNLLDELCLAQKGHIELDMSSDDIDMILELIATA